MCTLQIVCVINLSGAWGEKKWEIGRGIGRGKDIVERRICLKDGHNPLIMKTMTFSLFSETCHRAVGLSCCPGKHQRMLF